MAEEIVERYSAINPEPVIVGRLNADSLIALSLEALRLLNLLNGRPYSWKVSAPL